MHMPKTAGEEYSEASRLMQALDRLRHTWGAVRPCAPVRRGEVMLLGILMGQEHHGEPPLTIGELARRLRQSPSAITQKVNALEEAGAIRRTVGSSDRRVACVELTDKGRKMAEKSMRAYWEQLEQALGSLGKPDTETLILLMNRLCELLEANADETDGTVE